MDERGAIKTTPLCAWGDSRGILEVVKAGGKIASLRRTPVGTGSDQPDLAKLGRRIAAYAAHDGTFDPRIPGLHVSRFSCINSGRSHGLELLALCHITRGAKSVIVGQQARRLMLSGRLKARAASAWASSVRRNSAVNAAVFFGTAPAKDIARLRNDTPLSA